MCRTVLSLIQLWQCQPQTTEPKRSARSSWIVKTDGHQDRLCGSPPLGGFQDQTEESPEQPGLSLVADSALTAGWTRD